MKKTARPPKKPRYEPEDDPIILGEQSFAFFIYHYFTDLVLELELDLYHGDDHKGMHRDIADEMQECVERAQRARSAHRGPLWRYIIAPRKFAKSTMVRFLYLWLLAYPHKLKVREIINLSRDQAKARKNLEYVKQLLKDHPDFCADFGFTDPETAFENWNVDAIKSNEGTRADGVMRLSCLLSVYGRRGIRGMHPGIVVIDDPEETEDVQNPDVLDGYKEVFARDVMGSISIDLPMMLVGTLLSETSLVSHIVRGPDCKKGECLPGWEGKEYDAIKSDGTALWKAKFPLEWLEQTRMVMNALHEGSFEYEFMNDPRAFKNNVWPLLWWPDDTEPPVESNLGHWDGMNWVASRDAWHLTTIDPATKTSERNDYSACITAVVVLDRFSAFYGHAWIVNDWRAKISPHDLMEKMHKQAKSYPGRMGIEASHGDVFAELLPHERAMKGVKTKIDSLSPWGRNKEERARAGNTLVQMKRIHIAPWISKEFRHEVNKFPFNRPGHDDYADCLAYLQQMMLEHVLMRNPREKGQPLTAYQQMVRDWLESQKKPSKRLPPVGRSNLPC